MKKYKYTRYMFDINIDDTLKLINEQHPTWDIIHINTHVGYTSFSGEMPYNFITHIVIKEEVP